MTKKATNIAVIVCILLFTVSCVGSNDYEKMKLKAGKKEFAKLESDLKSFLEKNDISYEEGKKSIKYVTSSRNRFNFKVENLKLKRVTRGSNEKITLKDIKGKELLEIDVSYKNLDKLAIVIDNVGRDSDYLEEFLDLDLHLTYAITPYLKASKLVANTRFGI